MLARFCIDVRLQLTLWIAVVSMTLSGCMTTTPEGADDDSRSDHLDSQGDGAGARSWEFATLADATIRPGVRITMTSDVPVADLPNWCTSNFVFLDKNGSAYLGTAGHCERTVGAEVMVDGAEHPATVVYNSFTTMDEVGEEDRHVRLTNDFAVVALHEEDYVRLNPSVLHWGGPTAMANSSLLQVGDGLRTYGNTPLRPGPSDLDAREGSLVATEPWWGAASWDGSPGLSGDSGSTVVASDGQAVGVLTHFTLASENPINPDDRGGPSGSNKIVYLDMALEYARIHAGLDLQLAVADMSGPPELR